VIIGNFCSLSTPILWGLVDLFPVIEEDFVPFLPTPPTEVKFVDLESEIQFKDKE